jgi:hypothetical protein
MRKLMVIMAAALVLCGAFAMSAQATSTLADYIALGSTGVTIDDKLFFDFSYSGSGFGGAVAIPADGITVTPLTDPLNPGILFNAPWSVGPGQALDSLIQFKVQVLPGGNPIKDVSAEMVAFGTSPDGIITVAETTTFGNLLLHSNGGTVSSAEITFSPTMGVINVAKDISVNGNSGIAALSGVTNRFSEVPVPPAVLLFGTGLLGLVGFRFGKNRA